ncbi:S-adenosyl-L-methionine-dependent methyltransferase [Mollisia scopiformis]|uniref:S-adenosyl-L-methionine-dependent methyltransferase n=1 Tax=Mollisia scopiformis TaxID=149040 RepID=A0A132BC51_MOLSC|nr:S-adenosyl-L-methionine-dependent methyltransferase [Mollisia scopiformis]KUJ09237.1 S-adenosyl-L-methionine-dependent methyltransferase [Mollisia scopiformis]
MTSTPRPVQSVSNSELYNRWAKVYDTDGNILQAIDDVLLPPLLDQALNHFSSSAPITITELGCGTGRNTAKLLLPSITSNINITEINALDLSPSMLEVAKQRCEALLDSTAANATSAPPTLNFQVFDALDSSSLTESGLEGKADLVLSTLVLEHLPLDTFFKTVTKFLKPGCVLVLTNMHADMGRMSQAGFVDPETGEKVRGTSYVYKVDEVVQEGNKYGFYVVGKVAERQVTEEDIGEARLLGPRGKKWIGVNVWFGMVMRLRVDTV